MNIVIVEDELMIREGLQHLLEKLSPNYHILAVAEDGKKGVEMIRIHRPDLVITDVRMPNMDGLEMIEQMQAEGLNPKMIILSAYSEFDYARKALRFGVSEYILKPVSVMELKQALNKVEEELRAEKEKISDSYYLDNLLYRLLSNHEMTDSDTKNYLEDVYGIHNDRTFIVITAYMGKQYEEKKEVMEAWLEVCLDKAEVRYCNLFLPKENMMVTLLYEYEDKVRLKRMLEGERKSGTCVADAMGWGEFQTLDAFPEQYQKLKEQLDYTMVLGQDVLICYPQILDVKTEQLYYPYMLENEIKEIVFHMDATAFKNVLHRFEKHCFSGQVYAPKEIKECYTRFIWSFLKPVQELYAEKIQALEQQKLFESIAGGITKDELCQVMDTLYQCLCDNTEQKQDTYLIQRTKNLIHEFYAQSITLEEIARRLSVTPEYLGTQFRLQCNMNFSNYMKEYRVRKAKELLLGTQMKLYEVSNAVGYTDTRYFSQVFKGVTGETPGEYRKLHK